SHAKSPDSPLKGNANVFVFPNLEAANIGYKIAQRIGGAQAIGSVLQGLAKPANDLSRGCSADDVLHMIAITVNQAK
ncbi:phosphate acetyltransferase, partial [Brucella lupini]